MITRHQDPAKFRARVEPRLLAAEAANNLLLGLLAVVDKSALLVEIDEVGAALRTPPFNLVVSSLPASLVAELVAHLDDVELPGVMGPRATAMELARLYAERRALPAPRLHHRMRGFECGALIAPRPPVDGGQARAATVDDLPLVTEWVAAFNRDVATTAPLAADKLAARVAAGDFVLWHTDRPVAMAAISRRTPHGAAVAFVYTPEVARSRGYASSCVAALTRRILDGNGTAYLFTDLANPTSNKIYQALGYVAVGDFEEWRFTP